MRWCCTGFGHYGFVDCLLFEGLALSGVRIQGFWRLGFEPLFRLHRALGVWGLGCMGFWVNYPPLISSHARILPLLSDP